MKKIVKIEKGIRCWFTGTFDRVAYVYIRQRGRCNFIVVNNITDEYGNYIPCTYFADIQGFEGLDLQQGDLIRFRARYTICQDAQEALYGFRISNDGLYYRLMNPTKVTKLICPIRPLIEQQQCKIQITPSKMR